MIEQKIRNKRLGAARVDRDDALTVAARMASHYAGQCTRGTPELANALRVARRLSELDEQARGA